MVNAMECKQMQKGAEATRLNMEQQATRKKNKKTTTTEGSGAGSSQILVS
jgi:hypothetical protein